MREAVLRAIGALLYAALAGYAFGAVAYFLDHASDRTGLARRSLLPVISRGLTATAPARIERYQWHVDAIPEEDYRTGERLITWPELVFAYDTPAGTRRLHVRGLPNNTETPQTYMAHFAGIFGLPWIDFVASRRGTEHEQWMVESATNRDTDHLALLWAAPSPPLAVRYDPDDPERAWPTPLLAAYARPLSRDVATWIEAAVLALLGAALLWKLFLLAFRGRRRHALVAWLFALISAPFWTGRAEIVADLLGFSGAMASMFGSSLVNPAKIHRIEVDPLHQPVTAGSRWSLEQGGALVALLAPPPPRNIDLAARSEGGLAVTTHYANAINEALLALPDDELAAHLQQLCEPRRGSDLVDMLRPALDRLAAEGRCPRCAFCR